MSRKRPATRIAQPPWTYAPSEVMEWLSSGTQRVRAPKTAPPPTAKQITVPCTPAVSVRALRRFDDLVKPGRAGRWRAAAEAHLRQFERWKDLREGTHAGVSVRLSKREGSDGDVLRLRFHPPLPIARARRLLTQLGLPWEASTVS